MTVLVTLHSCCVVRGFYCFSAAMERVSLKIEIEVKCEIAPLLHLYRSSVSVYELIVQISPNMHS